jgi:hypothetical protein
VGGCRAHAPGGGRAGKVMLLFSVPPPVGGAVCEKVFVKTTSVIRSVAPGGSVCMAGAGLVRAAARSGSAARGLAKARATGELKSFRFPGVSSSTTLTTFTGAGPASPAMSSSPRAAEDPSFAQWTIANEFAWRCENVRPGGACELLEV